MKKNLLLTLVLSTLVGCSNVNDLFIIKSNSKYSTDYSNYTLVSITEKKPIN